MLPEMSISTTMLAGGKRTCVGMSIVTGSAASDRRVAPAARAEGLRPAHHQQPAAKVVDIGRERGLDALGHCAPGHIEQGHSVIGAQVAQAAGHLVGRDDLRVDLGRLERGGQVLRRAGRALDQQHARLAADKAIGLGGVILGPRVAGHLQPHDIAVEIGLRIRQHQLQRLSALRQLHLLVGDRRAAGAGDQQPPAGRRVALDVDLHPQALALARGGGYLHSADLRIQPIGQAAERQHIDRHAARRRHLRSGQRIAGVRAAIREQHQALVALARQQRQAELDGIIHIGRRAAGPRHHLAQRALGRGRALHQRALAEDHDRRAVIDGHPLERLLDKRLGAGALRERDRVGAIEQEHGCHRADRPDELRAAQP